MPRGEETQEAPQEEGRQESSEVQESEARRDAEVVAEPEAVVERERPVEESEAIEAAVVEAVEAVEAAVPAANGGSGTGDRESAADAATRDRGPGTEESAGAADAATGDRVEAPAPTGDGGKAYELRSDSQTGAQAVVERIESVESTRVSPPESAEAELQPERAESVPIREGGAAASPGEAESAEVQRGDVPQETAAPALEAEKSGEEISANAVKAVKGTSAAGSELPAEDEIGEGSSAAGDGTAPPVTTSATLAEVLVYVSKAENSDSPETGRITVDAPTSGAETVMIDTVPLPESPEAIFDSHDETSRETIGTWPTPDTSPEAGGVSPNLPEADLSSPDQGLDFEAAQDLEADQSENDQLANRDIQNTLQHQQQLINMLQGMASALQNTRDAIDRNADDGSYQAEVQEDSGREIRVDNAVSLSSELQNAVDQTARMQELMSNIMLKLETSSDQRVQILKDGETNPETSSMELALETDQGSDSTSVSTEFEDFDQKANQLFNILSTILKNMKEAESAIKRNLDGGGLENEQPEESPTESSPAIAEVFKEYNRELAGIVQQAETALGDTGEIETSESSEGNPDHPNTNPAGEGAPGFDRAGHDSTTADYSAELEEMNDSEITAEKADLGAAPSQTELNALEAELSAVEQDLAGYAAKVEAINELKSAVREEISCLQEELMNWPDDGSTREITYSDWIQNADGSFTETEYTKTMTKAEVQNLVEKLEALLETMGDQSQMDKMKLQDAMNSQSQLMQMMSNLSKMFHDTAMAIVRNLK